MQNIRVMFALAGWLAISTAAAESGGHMSSDPLLAKLLVDKLEVREVEGDNPVKWELEAWLGRDLQKLWLKTEGRRVDGTTAAAELQLLYDHAVSAYWDVQAGWRVDLEPDPQRDWFALGVKGLAPYFIELDAALFLGEGGRNALRIKAKHEMRLARRLILTPELEANAYGEDDPGRGLGSGLAEVSAGFRLHYLLARQFGPYVGIEGRKRFGDTADLARAAGRSDNAWLLAGVRGWF